MLHDTPLAPLVVPSVLTPLYLFSRLSLTAFVCSVKNHTRSRYFDVFVDGRVFVDVVTPPLMLLFFVLIDIFHHEVVIDGQMCPSHEHRRF